MQGMAYTGSSSPVTINIDFKEITCEVNGIIERHEIDGHIINIKAETVPASVAFKKKLQSLKNDLKTKTDEGSIALIKYSIKKIEEAGPALVLPAHVQIQGQTLQKDGKVVIESVNKWTTMKKHRTEILILFISSILIAFMVLIPTSAVALVLQTTGENQENFDFYILGLLVNDLFIILVG